MYAPLKTGEQMELKDCETGREVISALFPHKWSTPPRAIVIESTANDGRVVRIIISNDDSDAVKVAIEEPS